MKLITWLLSIWLAPALGKFIVEAPAAPAGSAPAAPAEPSTPDLSVPSSGADYDAWRMSGKLPAVKDDSAASDENETPETPNTDDSATSSADTSADSAAAPPAGKKGKTKEDTERRFQELLADRKRDRDRIAELERLAQPAPAKEPASQPVGTASEPEPKIDDVDAQGNPKYKTLGDYMTAARKWDRAQTIAEVEKNSTTRQQQATREQHLRVINESWKTKVEAARTKFADFDAVALNPDLKIVEGSVADAFVLDSEHGGEVLYHLGKNPAELEALSKLNPLRQARALFAIEQKFAKPAAPPAKKVTDAPRPPHEVNGGGRTAPDELEQAVKDGDEAGYIAAANRRDVSRRKGK